MPKVSIVVPIYCVEKYIARCAQSLFEQTLQDLEYIFVDDATPDKSMDILIDILNKYPVRSSQVILHRMDNNVGPAGARKWGICHASGGYVFCCDSDDWLTPYACEKMYKTAIEQSSDAVLCDFYLTDGTHHLYQMAGFVKDKGECISRLMFGKGSLALWNKFFKRDLYKKIKYPEGNMGEDYCMTVQLLLLSSKISYINEALYYYYSNPQSITSARVVNRVKIQNNFMHSLRNLQIMIDFFEERELTSVYAEELNAMKLYQKNLILRLISQPNLRTLWKNTFPELKFSIVFNRKVLFKERVKYLLGIISGIFPIVADLYSKNVGKKD